MDSFGGEELRMVPHCCEDMRREVERICDQHTDRFDCPDCLVDYSARLREYGLIVHNGGTASVLMRFCPWCGAALPTSLRDQWFDRLRAMGIDPWDGNIPEAYQSSTWWEAEERCQTSG
jgi:hypothetical protein